MFGNDSAPCRVFAYGARPATSGADLIDLQMRKAHQYRNRLVEVERLRRSKVDALLLTLCPDLSQTDAGIRKTEERLEGVLEAIGKASAAVGRKVRPAELVAEVKAARAELKVLRYRRKVLRTDLFASDGFKKANEALETAHKELLKKVRSESGLYWGTYLHVEQSCGGIRKGAPPKFMRWEGEGHLAIQIQGGMTVEELFSGKDTRIQVAPVPAEAYERGGRKLMRTVAKFRVGSDDSGEPVFAEIPLVMHRPIPGDGTIKWVHLVRHRTATKCSFSLQFVVARQSGWAKDDLASSGAVGIDVGWRIMPSDGRLRVAVWHGDDGSEGELALPKDWLTEMGKVRHLQSVRDVNMNEMKASFCSLLGRLEKPEWFVKAAEHIHHWKSAGRFAGLAIQWRDKRFPGDEDAFTLIEAWRKRDKHLFEYEANLREQLFGRRRDIYRNFAAMLRRRYKTAYIEDLDLRDFHELPAGEDAPENQAVREHTRDAALSYLIEALKHSVHTTVKVLAASTTSDCNVCGTKNDFDRKLIVTTCASCGAAWDQDTNAAINILKKGLSGNKAA